MHRRLFIGRSVDVNGENFLVVGVVAGVDRSSRHSASTPLLHLNHIRSKVLVRSHNRGGYLPKALAFYLLLRYNTSWI